MEGLSEAAERLPVRESQALKKIIRLYDDRKLPKALQAAEKLLLSCPDQPETICAKALILQAQGKLAEALDLAKAVLMKNLGNVMCWHTSGQLKQSEHQYKEALKHMTQAYRLSPESHIIQRDFGMLHLQLRHYEPFRDVRLKTLLARPSMGISWVAYSVAEFLCGHWDKAVEVIDSMLKSLGAQLSPVETSEVMLYRAYVLETAGKLQDATSYLNENERYMLDKVGLKEAQARIYLRLEQYANAADVIYSLLERNPENSEYHGWLRDLSRASGISPTDLYTELAEKYPTAHLIQRLPLDYASAEAFEPLLVAYISQRLRSGVPSLHADLKSLYADSEKAAILDRVLESMASCMQTQGKLTAECQQIEAPSVLFWLIYLRAAHYDKEKRYELAYETVEQAIAHTSTIPDVYTLKGRILKHRNDLEQAAETVNVGRQLDLADRYLNNKSAKYYLRANNTAKAKELMGLFSKEQGVLNVHEMQNMWYELEIAEANIRLQEWSQAAEELKFVDLQFAEIYEDQNDFHLYCFRKMTLLVYLKMIKFEDELYGQQRYCRAGKGLLRCYLADRNTVTKAKAVEVALKLLQLHDKDADAMTLCFSVFTEEQKYLLVLKCLAKLQSLRHPSLPQLLASAQMQISSAPVVVQGVWQQVWASLA